MFYFVRTANPRPTFHLDMTVEERSAMQRHVAYWTEEAKKGVAIVFGPVADPSGFFGILVADVRDESHLRELIANDPARNILAYSVLPMANAVTEKAVARP